MSDESTPNPRELSDLPEADQLAIIHTLTTLQHGFSQRDADSLSGVYSADADWVNAFGTSKRGSAEIVEYLRGLFADDNFNRGQVVQGPDIAIRVVTADVAIVSAHLVVEGQGLVDGGTMRRDNFSVRVLHRQADGTWPIISEMFQDANTEVTYAG